MRFRLVPKSVTLNDLERRNGVILRYFSEFGQLPGALRKSSRSLSHLLMSSCLLAFYSNYLKVKVKETYLCSAYCELLGAQAMARVSAGSHSFYLPPTRLSTSGMNHACLYLVQILIYSEILAENRRFEPTHLYLWRRSWGSPYWNFIKIFGRKISSLQAISWCCLRNHMFIRFDRTPTFHFISFKTRM